MTTGLSTDRSRSTPLSGRRRAGGAIGDKLRYGRATAAGMVAIAGTQGQSPGSMSPAGPPVGRFTPAGLALRAGRTALRSQVPPVRDLPFCHDWASASRAEHIRHESPAPREWQLPVGTCRPVARHPRAAAVPGDPPAGGEGGGLSAGRREPSIKLRVAAEPAPGAHDAQQCRPPRRPAFAHVWPPRRGRNASESLQHQQSRQLAVPRRHGHPEWYGNLAGR